MFSRQTLLGSDYELLNRTNGLPNPDYWGAVLWHKLVGRRVYGMTPGIGCDATCQFDLRFHCVDDFSGDGVVVIVVNFNLVNSYNITIGNMPLPAASAMTQNGSTIARSSPSQQVLQYRLSGQPGSNHIFFNDKPLLYSLAAVPVLAPASVAAGSELNVPPASVTFFRFQAAASAHFPVADADVAAA